ncbi:protein kinase [Pelatocladus sp. BLCC-F211]|uniref:protein kinase domain-containing protein n=1 Tax=Pelatocladus sp. BLCC-F211 TaxID=3342752 RepID=UPI0035B6BD72
MNQKQNHNSKEVPPTIPDDDTIRAFDKHNPNNGSIMSHWKFGQWLDKGSTIELVTDGYIYILKQTLGNGGFGITYLAEDRGGKEVVIKTLNEKMQSHPDFRKCKHYFYNEAVALAKCDHPHIVKIIKIDHHQELPCIVMEYIDGENLDEFVRRKGILREKEAIIYIQQIGGALTIVHNQNLLHRDVKPHNIIIRADGRGAVLIDFGIARNFIPQEQRPLTSFRSVGYTPIEQYKDDGKQGYHSDVHGLAATLYFMLTGKNPIDAETRVGTKKDQLEPPNKWNLNISNQVNQAILKGMERYYEDRSQTVQEWLELLLSPDHKNSSKHNDSENQERNEANKQPSNLGNHLTIQPIVPPDNKDPYLDPTPNKTPSQTQELLLGGTFIGFTYGLLTSPLASFIFAQWIVTGLWILFIVGLMFAECRGSFNFLSGKTLNFLSILVITAFVVILLLFGGLTEKLIILAMTVFSTGLSFLLMLVIPYLGVPRS